VKTSRPFRFEVLNPAYGGRAQVDHSIASFLRSYQLGGGYTPGPLLALFALAGLVGSVLGFGGRRLARALARAPVPAAADEVSGLGRACLVFFSSAVGVLLISDVFQFSWRYQLPALVTLPPAGVLGACAIWRVLGARRQVAVVRPAEPVPAASANAQTPV
jgi:hypothetical protein